MRRKQRPAAALALLAMVALISACGSNAPADAGGGSSGGTTTTNHGKAVKFAECMRKNRVGAFPDPPASGRLTIDGIANGSSLDTNSPTFRTALGACKELEPSGFMGQRATRQQAVARLKFARCMRESGVTDFPDPTPNGPLIDTNRIPSLVGKDPRSDPGFLAATHKCGAFATAAGVVAQ